MTTWYTYLCLLHLTGQPQTTEEERRGSLEQRPGYRQQQGENNDNHYCIYVRMYRSYMTMVVVVLRLPQRPAAQPHNLYTVHSTECFSRTQGARTNTGARWAANGGESRPWLSPASMLQLILHSAIRTFIPPSRATLFAFCSEAIQPASSLNKSDSPPAHHLVPSNAQVPRCSAAHVHRPVACHVGTTLGTCN